MASTFAFSADTLVTGSYLPLSGLTPGAGPGVNDPSQFSAVASGAIETSGDVDVFAVTLLAGQTYTFDIDDGAGDSSGGSVDLELDIIDFEGNLILSDDGSTTLDNGSASFLDPSVTVTVNQSGTYFIAVHSQNDEYIDDFFDFSRPGGGTGDYSIVVSTGGLPPITYLTTASETRTYNDSRQNIQALAGNDILTLLGGNDLAQGALGNDTIYGGLGDDELSGSSGFDNLQGGAGNDVLLGGGDADQLYGGDNNDDVNAGFGNDFVDGGNGNDVLWGEIGNDNIFGGNGDDFIRGGAEADTLYGGAGADTFHFLRGETPFDPTAPITTEDRIQDFSTLDVLDLSDLVSGALTFRGSGAFTGVNQVRVVDLRDSFGNGYQEVRINLDANTSTTEQAFLVDTSGNFTLAAGDFIL